MKYVSMSYSRMLQFTKRFKTSYLQLEQQKHFSLSSLLWCELNKDKTFKVIEEIKKQENSQLVQKKNYVPGFVPKEDQPIVDELKKGSIFHPYKDPFERMYKIMAEDVKVTLRRAVKALVNIQLGDLEVKYFPRHTDVLVIGCGAIGLLVAYSIKSQFPHGPNVIVIDKKLDFLSSSTNLGQGTLLQQQFTEKEEILMSQYCAEFLSSFHRHTEVDGHPQFEIPYEPLGSLFLADKNNAEELMKKSDILKGCRVRNELLQYKALKNKFPWLNVDDVLFGSLGMVNEGLYNPWAFLFALKCKAINLGVQFVTAEVIDFGLENDNLRRVICKLPDGSYNSIDFGYVVIAAGKESIFLNNVVRTSGGCVLRFDLPIEERKRYEYCFYNPNGPGLNTPIIVDPDGTYFRREGLAGHYVAGVSNVPNDEKEENGLHEVFYNKIKPFIMKRVPQFEKLDLVSGWIDTYDFNTANGVGIIGRHPEHPQVIIVNGFANNGIQHAPAVGRAVMELMIYEKYQTIDFDAFSIENQYRKQHLELDRKKRSLLESQHRIALN